MLPMGQTRYLTCAETAKLIRKALAADFPGQKFHVRSSVYSGGASIRVVWRNGPTVAQVRQVTDTYAGGGFDGMIDLAYNVTSWLTPDGRAGVAHSPGTTASRGSVPEFSQPIPSGAEIVHFGADYVFAERELDEWIIARARQHVADGYAGLTDYEAERIVRQTVEALAFTAV
jgi:hypothetical protein